MFFFLSLKSSCLVAYNLSCHVNKHVRVVDSRTSVERARGREVRVSYRLQERLLKPICTSPNYVSVSKMYESIKYLFPPKNVSKWNVLCCFNLFEINLCAFHRDADSAVNTESTHLLLNCDWWGNWINGDGHSLALPSRDYFTFAVKQHRIHSRLQYRARSILT